MKRKPIYIAIEGIDGSGKTVQIAQLLEEILAAGYRCREVSFPQYDGFFGEQIGAMLSGRHSVRADEVDARSMALWYAADRMRTMRDICPDDYDYIILNRYTLANAAYQGSRCTDRHPLEFAKWVFHMEEVEFQLPVPDLYLIFDVSPALSARNVPAKGYRGYTGDSAEVYEKSSSILTDARSLYREFAAMYDSMELLDCQENGRMKSPEAIHQAVMEILSKRGLWDR